MPPAKPPRKDQDAALAAAFAALRDGRRHEAERLFRRILAQQEAAPALHGLGIVLLQGGKAQQALGFLQRARRASAQGAAPPDAVLLGNLASAHAALGQHGDARACLQEALRLDPDNAVLHYNLGNAALALGDPPAAIAAYDAALAIAPQLSQAWKNKGNAAARLFLRETALDCYQRARALAPDDPEIDANIAASLDILNKREAARDLLQAAIARHPATPLLHWNLAPVLLALGDLAAGFAAFEYRLHPDSPRWMREAVPQAPRRLPGTRLQPGMALAGKTIFVHAEQGFGDGIQFCRYGAMLAQAGANVLLEAPAPLHRLYQTLTPPLTLVRAGQAPPRYDAYVPLMSLPLIFGTTLQTIPGGTPYLSADPGRVADFAQYLARGDAGAGCAPRRRIGVAWSGNPMLANNAIRSAPLAEIATLFDPQFRFICVQKDIAADEQALAASLGIESLPGEISDFADTAALMQNLDAVVSVDSAPLHLAGALRRPAFALLYQAAEWRWLMHREDSPWYPQMRLMRQQTAGDWRELAARTLAALRQMFS